MRRCVSPFPVYVANGSSIDEEEWLSDSDLWGEETFEEYFPTIHVSLDDYDEKEIYKQLFDFDAESAFKSIDWSLS